MHFAFGKKRQPTNHSDQELLAWCAKMGAAETLEEKQRVGPMPRAEYARHHTQQSAEIHMNLLESMISQQEAATWFAEFQKTHTDMPPDELLATLRTNTKLFEHLDIYRREWLESKIPVAVYQWIDSLLAAIRGGDAEAFKTLRDFVQDKYDEHEVVKSQFEQIMDFQYVYPEDWDKLMVQFVLTPTISDFKNAPKFISQAELRLFAAAALRIQSLELAQLCLALWDDKWVANNPPVYVSTFPYQDPLTANLLADLPDMVVVLQSKLPTLTAMVKKIADTSGESDESEESDEPIAQPEPEPESEPEPNPAEPDVEAPAQP